MSPGMATSHSCVFSDPGAFVGRIDRKPGRQAPDRRDSGAIRTEHAYDMATRTKPLAHGGGDRRSGRQNKCLRSRPLSLERFVYTLPHEKNRLNTRNIVSPPLSRYWRRM